MINRVDVSRNALLGGLPPDELKRILPHLHLVQLSLGHTLYNGGQAIDHVYFPDDAVISLLATLENGRSVEVTMIGNEGVLGVHAALGGKVSVNAAIAQIPGACWKLKSTIFRAEFQRDGVLHRELLAYTLSLLTQISQTAACNRVHLLEQRMARWLLMVADRTHRQEFPITHDFLAHMLGTPRSEVTLAAGAFRTAGLIHYTRGKLKILSLTALESAACECYRADQATAHLLPRKR